MSSNEQYISERDFDEIWGCFQKASGDFFEFQDVCKMPVDRVWTVVETGDSCDENWYAQPGFHVVNKVGYVLTKLAWSASTPDAIYFLDD